MTPRRRFIKYLTGLLAAAVLPLSRLAGLRNAVARIRKTVLPPGTALHTLINRNPKNLDASRLPIMPVADFGVMGTMDHTANMATWRLAVDGAVSRPLSIGYTELVGRPALEKKVLMICPGVFVNHGRWKGVTVADLLADAGADPDATHVIFSEAAGLGSKQKRFSVADIRSNKVFLAYAVNGRPLPRRHGFPLRVVAEDYYGADWVKYVRRLTVVKK